MLRLLGLLLLTPCFVFASSGSYTKNCVGKVTYCEKPATHNSCREEHVTIFASQVAAVFDNEISNESHTLTLGGFLAQKGEPKLLGASGDYIVYKGEKYLLAVPYNPSLKLAAKQIGALDSPDGAGWQTLCQ